MSDKRDIQNWIVTILYRFYKNGKKYFCNLELQEILQLNRPAVGIIPQEISNVTTVLLHKRKAIAKNPIGYRQGYIYMIKNISIIKKMIKKSDQYPDALADFLTDPNWMEKYKDPDYKIKILRVGTHHKTLKLPPPEPAKVSHVVMKQENGIVQRIQVDLDAWKEKRRELHMEVEICNQEINRLQNFIYGE